MKVTTKVRNVSECLSGWYFLNYRTFYYQIWHGDAASWARVMRNCLLLLLSSRSYTTRAHMIDIWPFLLYYLKCWLLGNQTWSDDTSSKTRVSYERQSGLLHSGSRSQRRVKMLMFVQMISSRALNILFSNLVLWFIISSQRVMQEDWFAIFKVKVTARAHMI